ncbi:hypothetical protein D4764_15G0006850 [Takifugu flavidus]|uniref:PiggyBac transposable element-derived protein domain-containing protein n=1 Tax=Takifugu flavidus TaxID=433684 RepID=A0A5C6P3G9_9TELE|nr:hypothetical protein D4764_15G0006850 [Takifugu flavidus]
MVPRPAIVETYNKFMGGVDLLDMLSALYKFSFGSRRWYMYIWWHTVTVAVINAWHLYSRDQKKLEPQIKPMGLKQPGDTIVIVQLQTWGVIGAQQLKGHVLLNGVSLPPTNQEVDGIIKSMSVDEHLLNVNGVNLTSVLRSCTVLRSRECILKGSELHWTDRIFCDGKVYLTLSPNDTWMPHVPQAMALKVLWDQEIGRTREERIRLEEGCFRFEAAWR